jgi:N-carbamoylputrescine amidase
MREYQVITTSGPLVSPASVEEPTRQPVRVGAVQQRWREDAARHRGALADGIRIAAAEGAQLVCLPELTLYPYFPAAAKGLAAAGVRPETVEDGPTREFASELASETGTIVHASLFEQSDPNETLGYNTAIAVAPDGKLLTRTRKLHIPVTAGYREHHYFRPGPAGPDPFPLVDVAGAKVGFPTCWDQWFPELARAYGLAGAEVIVYPTAIGSEPDHPGFDTQPLWEQVIRANGIANGTFMVAINRIGREGPLTFYGSSFVSDPYGRVLAQAPRDRPAVLVADLDIAQREEWLALFPFFTTRRPDLYHSLVQ